MDSIYVGSQMEGRKDTRLRRRRVENMDDQNQRDIDTNGERERERERGQFLEDKRPIEASFLKGGDSP